MGTIGTTLATAGAIIAGTSAAQAVIIIAGTIAHFELVWYLFTRKPVFFTKCGHDFGDKWGTDMGTEYFSPDPDILRGLRCKKLHSTYKELEKSSRTCHGNMGKSDLLERAERNKRISTLRALVLSECDLDPPHNWHSNISGHTSELCQSLRLAGTCASFV